MCTWVEKFTHCPELGNPVPEIILQVSSFQMRTQSGLITLPNGFYAETQKSWNVVLANPRMKCRRAMQITEIKM